MNAPFVSICIPVYNGAQYLKRCLDSCLKQTFTDFEVVVCDDFSTDNSKELVQSYVLKDTRVKLYQNHSNTGLVGNWNNTLNHARGHYIKWLFQDDWMENNALEEFVKAAKEGYDFVLSKRNFILDDNATLADKHYYQNEVKKLDDYVPLDSTGHFFSVKDIARFSTEFIALNFIGEPSLCFFKRDLLKQTGMYDGKFHQICDLEFNLRLASIKGVYLINLPLCSFAVHAQSTTSKNLEKKYFQLRFIEQAYYAYKIAHHKCFKGLQEQLGIVQKIKLRIYYLFRIFEARRYVKDQSNASELFNKLNLLEKEMGTMLNVLKILKPVFYAFYLLKK